MTEVEEMPEVKLDLLTPPHPIVHNDPFKFKNQKQVYFLTTNLISFIKKVK